MKIAEKAKEYLKRMSEGDEDMDFMETLESVTRLDTSQMNPNERSLANGAMHLFTSALIASIKNTKEFSEVAVAAEIDRREAIIIKDWVEEKGQYKRTFKTPSDALDYIKIMRECGLRAKTLQPVSDDTTILTMSQADYQTLHLLMEGRQQEIL